MTVVNPVTIGTAVRVVGAAFNLLGGSGLTREQRQAIEAAKAAGYGTGVRGYRDPQGRAVSQAEVIRAGRAAQQALPDAPPARRPSDPGYRPDLTEKRVPPLKRPPAPPASRVPKLPGRFGRIAEGIGTIAGGIIGAETIIKGAETILTDAPKPPPQQPPTIIKYPGWADPAGYVPQSPPIAPPAPAPRAPAAPQAPVDRMDGLSELRIYTPYVFAPLPAPPAPSGASSSTTGRTILGMSPAQLATLAVPSLLALLTARSNSRQRDALTPGLGLTPNLGAVPLASFGGFGGFGASSSTAQCDCAPKRRKAKKKLREVCYSGTFIERAGSLSKTRKRKVPCR